MFRKFWIAYSYHTVFLVVRRLQITAQKIAKSPFNAFSYEMRIWLGFSWAVKSLICKYADF